MKRRVTLIAVAIVVMLSGCVAVPVQEPYYAAPGYYYSPPPPPVYYGPSFGFSYRSGGGWHHRRWR